MSTGLSEIASLDPSKVTICIGDIHGHFSKLLPLWSLLEARVGSETFKKCTVIFLGDYNDRGPQTREVLDWLVALPSTWPHQRHVFLAGNHDFSFASFIGALPPTYPPDFDFSSTWNQHLADEYREGWWTGEGAARMHLQGRRWGGELRDKVGKRLGNPYQFKGSTYDSMTTFHSYGVEHGDREGLVAAVPESHKEFLRSMSFIHKQEGVDTGDPSTSFSSLIAVHAGLVATEPLEDQLTVLRNREVTHARLEALSGRKNVWELHPDLGAKNVLMVSGHHGALDIKPNRLIIDEGGGIEENPIAAIVLPWKIIVRSDETPTSLENQGDMKALERELAPC